MYGKRYEPPKGPTQGHKQGRYVTATSGYLERPNEDRIDLHNLLTNHSPSVELVPIVTNIMRASGLHHGAIAVVDKAIMPTEGRLVVVRFNGVVVIRRLQKKAGRWCFCADDPREETLYITEDDIVERLGVVTHSIINMI